MAADATEGGCWDGGFGAVVEDNGCARGMLFGGGVWVGGERRAANAPGEFCSVGVGLGGDFDDGWGVGL